MNKVILFALFAIAISALRFPIIQPRIPIPVHNHSVEVEDFKLPPITITIGKELEVEQFGLKNIGNIADTVGKVAGVVSGISRTFGGKYEVEDLKLPPHVTPFIPPRDEVEDLRLPRNRTNTKKNESEVEDFKLPPITITIGKELEVEDFRLPIFNRSRNHTSNRTNKTHNHSHRQNNSKKNESEVEDFKLPPITITIGKEFEVEDLSISQLVPHTHIGSKAIEIEDFRIARNRSHNHTHNRTNRTHNQSHQRNHSKSNESEVEDFKLPPITITIGKELEVEDFRLSTFNRSRNRTHNRTNKTHNHSHHRNNSKKNESEVEDFKLPPITITIGKELEIEDLRLPTHNRFNISRLNNTQNKTHNHNKTHNRTHNKTHNQTHNKSHGNKSRKNQTEVEDFKLPPITITIGKELEVEQFGLKNIGNIADTVGKVAGVVSGISRTFGGKYEVEAVDVDSNIEFLSF